MTSLRDQVEARRRELEHEPDRAILLPFPGFDNLMVQYRPLSYRESWRIEDKHAKVKDGAEQALLIAADKLVAACERIVTSNGIPDEYTDTGLKLGVRLAREEFGLPLPEGTTARAAVLAIFRDQSVFGEDGEELLVRLAADYEDQREPKAEQITSSVEGESEADSAAT